MASKTYYDILGVADNATSEEIRNAYIIRSKMFHPDRFDRSAEVNEWNLANEMLKELNQAYLVLRDPSARSAYDSTLRVDRQQSSNSTQQSTPQRTSSTAYGPPPVNLGRLCSGYSRYQSLPQTVRDRITARVNRQVAQQFMVPLRGVGWNYFFLLLSLGWFFLLFILAQSERWTQEGLYWLGGITLGASLFAAANLSWIVRWHRSPWKCTFMVSPLYFIKTRLDEVWYWPLWELKGLRATQKFRNGSFTGTEVSMVFSTGRETFTFYQRDAYEEAISAARAFDSKLRSAKQQGQYEYFVTEDDFRGCDPKPALKPRHSPSKVTILCTSLFTAFGVIIFFDAREINLSSFPYAPPTRFPSTTTLPRYAPTPIPQFSEPVLPTPRSGEVRRYSTQRGLAPLQIQSSSDSNYLVKLDDVSTGQPMLSIFVRAGQTEGVDVPLGTYFLKYASGDKWYGYTHLFGPDTQYSKAERNFTFSYDGKQYRGYTVTLYKVQDGNLRTSKISPDQF
jgi:hypothetical protein